MSNPQTNNQSSPEEYLINWMKTFVEKPHPLLGGMPPCPFARQARIGKKIKIIELLPDQPDSVVREHCLACDFDKTEVLLLVCDPSRWTADQTYRFRCELNQEFKDRDIVILEDHPDYRETIAGVSMSNGRYCILFAQRRSKLNQFSRQLKKTTKYYKNWSQSDLDDVVIWREDPQ